MLRPLNKRVLILPDPVELTTASGFLLKDDAVEKPMTGKVIAGDTELVERNDHVLFSKYGYDEVKLEETTYYLVSESTLLAILS